MSFNFWLRHLRSAHFRGGNPTRSGHRHAASGFRPRLELLEDRTAPAVLTVNSTIDTDNNSDSYLSLREAIAIVNSPTLPGDLSPQILAQITGTLHASQQDTIQFSVTGPITFGNSDSPVHHPLAVTLPAATATVTIDGGTGMTLKGDSWYTDGAGLFRDPITGAYLGGIFTVEHGADAMLTNLGLVNGYGNWGGAIINQGTLTLSNCTLSGNVAEELGQAVVLNGGGAVLNLGTMAINNCQFLNNQAFSDSPQWRGGGAILNFGSTTISGSTFTGNRAGDTEFGSDWDTGILGGYGGAILNFGSTTIKGSTFADNHAGYAGTNSETGEYGGYGGGICSLSGTVSLQDDSNGNHCVFSTNTATGDGGAIAVKGGSLNMSDCTVNGNTAYVYGGGMYVDPAIINIVSCTFTGNGAPAGADLYNLDSPVTIVASSIANVTSTGGTIIDPLADLLAQVAALNLSTGVTNSLTSKLQAAERSLADSNTAAAENQLNAFVNQIDALANSHRLGQLTADSFAAEVDDLLNVVG